MRENESIAIISLSPVSIITSIVLIHYSTFSTRSFTTALSLTMPFDIVEWKCLNCDVVFSKKQRTHRPCGELTNWTCLITEQSGKYDSYRGHLRHCEYCSPDLDHAIHAEREANKENRMEAVEIDEKGQSYRMDTFRTLPFLSLRRLLTPPLPAVC
jgi:hypothetical protein